MVHGSEPAARIQDLGYYPLGSKFFSHLAHYVRSGDFVVNLVVNSETLDELAFSLGALSHYIADSYGHGRANRTFILTGSASRPKIRL